MKARVTLLLLVAVSCATAIPTGGAKSSAALGMERKLARIESNGSSAHEPARTEFTENEINAYFAAQEIDLPAGVQSVHFSSAPGIVTATTRVDFEKIKSGDGSFNPLLEVFSGVHDVVVVAHAHGEGGVGYVQVDTVSLDGVNIPRFALQLFAEKYVQRRYPDLGLDSKFRLPVRIDSATVGAHELTVTQK